MMKFIQYNLRNGDLLQGTLCVSEDNPSEAYIRDASQNQTSSNGVMILGVKDRNRAQDGDVVVVKLKDRNQWIVREDKCEAWINGTLDVPCDEDGLPLTIPPVKVELDESDESVILKQAINVLPVGLRHRINKDKIKEPVPMIKSKRYTRENFLRMGVQLALLVKEEENKGGKKPDITDKSPITPAEFEEEVLLQLADLFVSKPGDSEENPGDSNALPQSPSKQKQANGGQRRRTYRFVGELDDDFGAIPTVCLQKTARVLFVSEPKSNSNNKVEDFS